MTTPNRAIVSGLGPLTQPLGTPAATKPMTGTGISNTTVGATGEKVLSTTSDNKKIRRVKIYAPTGGSFLGYTTVANGGSASTMTAVGNGTATDGSIVQGGTEEWISLLGNQELWLAGNAAGTKYQLTVVED